MKQLSMLLIAMAMTSTLCAQNEPAKENWKLKATFARFNTGTTFSTRGGNFEKYIIGNFRVEANYIFNRAIEAGVFTSYSQTTLDPSSVFSTTRSHIMFYGGATNVQLLHFFLKKEGLRPEVYLRGEVGGNYYTTPFRGDSAHHLDYGIGGGVAYYLWKSVGLNLEYTYGAGMRLRYGVSFKF